MLDAAKRAAHAELELYVADLQKKSVLDQSGSENDRRLNTYLGAAKKYLFRPIRVAIIGEINAGKTSLANLLLGTDILPTDVVNNTASPVILRYDQKTHIRCYDKLMRSETCNMSGLHKLSTQPGFLLETFLPLLILQFIEILDTPSTESFPLGERENQLLLSRCEMVIWCSMSTRVWTASEKNIWTTLSENLKKSCLFVLTNSDKLSEQSTSVIAERIMSDPILSGMRFTFLATLSAGTARNFRGQIVDKDLWNKSGGTQLFYNLGELVKKVFANRRLRVDEGFKQLSRKQGSQSVSRHPQAIGSEWEKLRALFEAGSEADNANVVSSTQIVSAIKSFKNEHCDPVLRSHGLAESDIVDFLDLFPSSLQDIDHIKGANHSYNLARLHAQLVEEIKDYELYLHNSNARH